VLKYVIVIILFSSWNVNINFLKLFNSLLYLENNIILRYGIIYFYANKDFVINKEAICRVSSQIDASHLNAIYLFWYNIYFMCNLFEYY